MKRRWLLVVIVCLLTLNGCTQTTEKEENKPNKNTISQEDLEKVAQQAGGTLNLSMRMVKTLNPLVNEDETVDRVLKLLYFPLIAMNEERKPSPSIAKEWQFSADGTVLDITLRDDLQWHDGGSITAEDVVYSLRTIGAAGEKSVYYHVLDYVSSYTATGRNSVQIRFRQQFSGNLYALDFPVISAGYYGGGSGVNSDKNMEPMGSGYYQFEGYTPAKEMRLKKFDTAMGTSPYIDSVVVSVGANQDTDLYSFDQGIIDALSADVTKIGKYDLDQNAKIFEYSTNYYDFVGFNFRNTILQEKEIRKAVAYGLPKETILESVYLSHGMATDTMVNPASWLYEKETATYPYDLQKGKKVLQKAGWLDIDGDGIRDKKTAEKMTPLRVRILANEENAERKQIANRLGDELLAMGFGVTVELVPFAEYESRLQKGDFDIFIGGWDMSPVPDYSFLFHSSSIATTNYGGYQDEKMDELLGNANTAVDETQMKSAYSALQKYAAEELPCVSIAFRNKTLFTSGRVYGNVVPLEDNLFATVNQWSLYDTAKR